MAEDFFVPPNHTRFRAKALTEDPSCSLAVIEPGGGGPDPDHTHRHDHLFFVIRGTATIRMDGKELNIEEDQALLVPGSSLHSIWNREDRELKMIGVSILPGKDGPGETPPPASEDAE